jgi:F0F1-type ATP synthase membrane subunit c/vacuolar-type H+-ATPase subunit K
MRTRRSRQGHLHHGLQPGGRGGEGAAHYVQKPDQVRAAQSLRPSRRARTHTHAAATTPPRVHFCRMNAARHAVSTALTWKRAAPQHATRRSVIFCEATAIYGVIVAIILQTKIDEVPRNADGTFLSAAVFSGYAVFASGITVGLANLACGYGESLCSACGLYVCACADARCITIAIAACAWASSGAAAR